MGAFSRRYATGIRRGREPWVETHGYHHEVAPRLLMLFSSRSDDLTVAVDFSPRIANRTDRVAERRLNIRATPDFLRLMANTFTSLHCHIIFSTKNREPWIRADIEERVWSYLGGIA